jgi:hypothetical protein
MQIPRLFYGKRAEIKSRFAPLMKELKAGAPLDTLDFGPTMATSDASSASLLVNPGRIGSLSDDFHCYALLYGLMEATHKRGLDRRYFDEAFVWSLSAPWAFVGTLGEAGGVFFLKMPPEAFNRTPPPELLRGKPEWHGPYLRATLRHWDALVREGDRFASAPLGVPKEFTRVAIALGHVLGDCGVVHSAADGDTPGKILAAVHRALAIVERAASA